MALREGSWKTCISVAIGRLALLVSMYRSTLSAFQLGVQQVEQPILNQLLVRNQALLAHTLLSQHSANLFHFSSISYPSQPSLPP